jgi:hypothetical protein
VSYSLLELVDALASISLADEVDDLSRLAELLEQRQILLSEIQAADWDALTPEQRAEAEERVQLVRTRDAEVLEYLEALRADTQKALSQLASGRAAVRGYAGVSESEGRGTRKVG